MATEILRPNAAGDECSISGQIGAACPNHYQNVDEAVADDATTVVATAATSYERDLYNLPSHSVGSGTINHITIYFRCAGYSVAAAKPSMKNGTTVTDGTEVATTTSWVTYSEQFSTNPDTGSAWTWDDIDDLQIGVSLKKTSTDQANCTQVYVEVDYTTATDYPISLSPGLIVSATVLKGWGRAIATTANLTVSATVVKTKGFVKTTISNLTSSATVNRVVSYTRATTAGLTVAATIVKSWGRIITTTANLAVSAIVNKAIAYKRAVSSGLAASAAITKSFGKKVAMQPALSISATIARNVSYKKAIQTGLAISLTITRAIAYARAITADLTAAVSIIITFLLDWIALTLQPRSIAMTLQSRSLNMALKARSLAITLKSRSLSLTLKVRSLLLSLRKRS